MRLTPLRRQWERLGRQEPFFAVLTDINNRFGGPDIERFFRSGRDELEARLQRAREVGVVVPRRRALDFGCGVGRVTQAMGYHFEQTDGVDISAPMLKLARRHTRNSKRCTYHRNVATDLSLFADASFSFVHSTLVLQHMQPAHSTRYIREFMRVLAPDGLLVFQLPSHRAVHAPSANAVRTLSDGPLPHDGFRAHISIEPDSLSFSANELATIRVGVENRSTSVWHTLPGATGRHQIKLANHWLHEDGELLRRDDGRCPLPYDLMPGSRVELLLGVTAPQFDGDYQLELDLVQENVGWFADRGSTSLCIPTRITGGLPGPHPRVRLDASEARLQTPFRERHPHVFRAFRATGLRDIYWRGRRGVDAVKERRDRMVRRLINPIIKWWKGRPQPEKMDMHCVPRSDVLAILQEAGGHVVDVEEEMMPGGFQSCRYWVTKKSVE